MTQRRRRLMALMENLITDLEETVEQPATPDQVRGAPATQGGGGQVRGTPADRGTEQGGWEEEH